MGTGDVNSGTFPNPEGAPTTAEDRLGETLDRGGGRTSVEGSESDMRSDARSFSDPERMAHDANQPGEGQQDASLSDTINCSDITGLDCDYVARPDDSADWADRGAVSQQLLAQLTTHIGTQHPDRVLSEKEIETIRERITSS